MSRGQLAPALGVLCLFGAYATAYTLGQQTFGSGGSWFYWLTGSSRFAGPQTSSGGGGGGGGATPAQQAKKLAQIGTSPSKVIRH